MMRKTFLFLVCGAVVLVSSGCSALLIGVAAGGVGMYAASSDAIQGESVMSYEAIWHAAREIARIRGTISKEDYKAGVIELDADSSKVWIRVVKLTSETTRLRVAARKFKLPNLTLAQDMFLKIMDQAKQ